MFLTDLGIFFCLSQAFTSSTPLWQYLSRFPGNTYEFFEVRTFRNVGISFLLSDFENNHCNASVRLMFSVT